MIDKYFKYARFFYRYLGYRIWISLAASMAVAILDGIGLTMFLPLLQIADGGGPAVGEAEIGRMGFVLDGIRWTGVELTVVSILVLMLVFFSLKGVARFCSEYYRVILQQRFTNLMRLENMNLLAGYDYAAFTNADSGRIQNTFSAEVTQIAGAYKAYFMMLQAAVMLLVYVGMACLANPAFALIVGVGGVLSNMAFSRIYRATKKNSRRLTKEMHRFQGFLIQSVASFKYLKATNLIQRYKRKVDSSVTTIERHQREVGRMAAISNSLREPVVVFIVAAAIFIQLYFFDQRLAGIVLSLLFLYRGLNALNTVQTQYNSFLGVSGSMENMEAFMADLRAHQEPAGRQGLKKIEGGIVINNLTFSHGDRPLLEGLSLEIKPYQTLGIVGGSGVGKTTLVNILCGLLRVGPGQLIVNGKDIVDFDVRDYRSRIGYVTQEAQVFNDTVWNNIAFWDEEADEDRIWQALANAHADDFVRSLPQGIRTVVGMNGVKLSGGQRQRLSIARELYRAVDLLILDEATSSLDSQSEALIQQNIEELSGQYTMLVVAHRLSTIRTADKILLLQPNRRYQLGTFSELRNESSAFRRMVELQSIG